MQQQRRNPRGPQQIGGLAAEQQAAQRRMAVGVDDQDVDLAFLDVAGGVPGMGSAINRHAAWRVLEESG